MNATDFLRQDHEVMGRLIDETIASPDGPERQETVKRLVTALDVHLRIEEELFYPMLAALSGVIPEAHREHAQMRALAAGIDHRQATSPDFLLKLGDLRDAVRRHVAEEEGALFPEAERLGREQLQTVGQQLEGRRHELMKESPTAGPATRTT